MDWIDDTVAVGDWFDGFSVQRRRQNNIQLIVDSRVLFTKGLLPRGRVPIAQFLLKARDEIMELVPLHPKVLIFCSRGRDRSPFLAMMYIMKRYGMGCKEAYEMVASKRRQTVFHWDWVTVVGLDRSK